MIAPYVASVTAGTVAGMIVGDALGAVQTAANVPATSASVSPKSTADGTPVSGALTARQTVFFAAGIVVLALLTLLGGARVFRDARIG